VRGELYRGGSQHACTAHHEGMVKPSGVHFAPRTTRPGREQLFAFESVPSTCDFGRDYTAAAGSETTECDCGGAREGAHAPPAAGPRSSPRAPSGHRPGLRGPRVAWDVDHRV